MKTYNITKLLLTLCSCVCATFAMAQVNESDRLELVNFYNASCGEGCTLDWDLDQPVSTWEGISLNGNGRVSGIDLSQKGLTGNIPDFQLPALSALTLTKNELSGSIPDFSGVSSGFFQLFLDRNELTGTIPDFSNLPQLFWLNLTQNNLTGEIPNFSKIKDLSWLLLGGNELTGNIPHFDSLSKLTDISLYGNQLTGEIPDFDLPKLSALTLSANELTGNIPNFTNLPELTKLYLYYNELSGTVPDFSHLSKLKYVHIQHNQFTQTDIATNFDVNNNAIDDFDYSPQYYGTPQFETRPEGEPLTISPDPPIPNANPNVRWMKNGGYITQYQVNATTYTFPSLGMSNIGTYRYFFKDETLMPIVEFQSQPIYVQIEGYDLSGAPVIPGQLILDYGVGRSLTEIDSLRDDLTNNYHGNLLNTCGCSVQVDLWEFSGDTIDMVREDLEIDGKNDKHLGNSDIDGGQNTNTSQGLLYNPDNGEQIAVNVSPLTSGEASVVIGVLDTGLDTAHPDVTSNIWNNSDGTANNDDQNCYINDIHGYNFVNHNGSIDDDHGHGTNVGGVIAANVPEGIDIKVMPVKTFDNDGNGTMYNMICGIHYAIDNGADIINISGGYKGHKSSVLQKTIQYGRENDMLFVVSAGNDSIDLDKHEYWPASFSKDEILAKTMITVTSIDATYNLSSNAGYGDTTVTVAAQGEGVFSPMKDGGYAHFTGTSISTPLVALALGIEKTQNPNRNYTTLRSDFLNSLDTIERLTDYVEKGRVLTVGINNLNTIIINPEYVCVGTLAGTTSFSIYSNIDFEVSTDADWVTLLSESGSGKTELGIDYDPNTTSDSRSATITVTGGGKTYTGYLIQKGTMPDLVDLAINEPFINRDTIYKAASNTITTTGVIGSDASVHYYAGGSIVMNAGFHAQPGSYFLASIGSCKQEDNKEEQLMPQISLRSYPNPFTSQTTIEYSLSEDSEITLIISDVAGRQIAIPINHETKTAGTHKVIFDGSQLPSGMYYYTIKTGDYFGTQKMILAK